MLEKIAARLRSEPEEDLVAAARKHDEAAVRSIIQTHNRMLYRLARSIVASDDEAEDVVQAAYVRAFTLLAGFRGDARIGTWLGRIVINEALGRLRRDRPSMTIDALETIPAAEVIPFPFSNPPPDPERRMAQNQIRQVVERAIDELPEAFRLVLVARLVEGMSVEDTADLLGIRPETVKTRLFRARALLRGALERRLGRVLQDAFPFAGLRCQRVADHVVAALQGRN